MRPVAGNRLPRIVAPETVSAGDLVRAVYPSIRGVVVEMTGILHTRVEHGSRIQWRSQEGANIFSYSPGYPKNPRIILLQRPEYPQQVLSWFEGKNERTD